MMQLPSKYMFPRNNCNQLKFLTFHYEHGVALSLFESELFIYDVSNDHLHWFSRALKPLQFLLLKVFFFIRRY